MVDRAARDRLVEATEEFLSEAIGAFGFDDRISAVADKTGDETVREVAHLLWYHYDDIENHKVALSQGEWDYIQRLLLLLRSDAALKRDRHRQWTWRQAIALAAIVVFVVGLLLLGTGWELFAITIPLGAVSILLSCWPAERAEADSEAELARLTPYSSVAQLLAVHRTVPTFRKRKCPRAIRKRRIRRDVATGVLWMYAGAMWLVFSPVILLFQAVPRARSTHRVLPA